MWYILWMNNQRYIGRLERTNQDGSRTFTDCYMIIDGLTPQSVDQVVSNSSEVQLVLGKNVDTFDYDSSGPDPSPDRVAYMVIVTPDPLFGKGFTLERYSGPCAPIGNFDTMPKHLATVLKNCIESVKTSEWEDHD